MSSVAVRYRYPCSGSVTLLCVCSTLVQGTLRYLRYLRYSTLYSSRPAYQMHDGCDVPMRHSAWGGEAMVRFQGTVRGCLLVGADAGVVC